MFAVMHCRSHRYRRYGPGALALLLFSLIPTTLQSNVSALISEASNFTIDDASSGDDFHTAPIYTSNIPLDSTDQGIAQWANQGCNGCWNPPDAGKVFNSTYATLYLPPGNSNEYGISFQFNGSAIDVYLVLSNQSNTECQFALDDLPITNYSGSTTELYEYNVLAYSLDSLDQSMHSLKIMTEGKQDVGNYLAFDFANYTRHFQTSVTPTNQTANTNPPSNGHITANAIAGGLAGGFIAVILIVVLTTIYRRKRQRKHGKSVLPPFRSSSRVSTLTEEQRLVPRPFPLHQHHHFFSRSGAVVPDSHPGTHYREQLRQQRQLELNNRLESMARRVRDMKATVTVEQQQPVQPPVHGFGTDDDGGHPPAFRIVPGGLGPHHRDPMLADMREQMRVMMNQIQYLRTQQNSSYVQGLTDELPPGYIEGINSGRRP